MLLVCEGMPDALTAAQAGFPAVGLLGAHTPDEESPPGSPTTPPTPTAEIVLVCDPDPAGRRVADVLAPLLEQHGQVPSVVEPAERIRPERLGPAATPTGRTSSRRKSAGADLTAPTRPRAPSHRRTELDIGDRSLKTTGRRLMSHPIVNLVGDGSRDDRNALLHNLTALEEP